MMKSYEIRLQGAACLNRDFNKAVTVLRLSGSMFIAIGWQVTHTSHCLASKIMQDSIRCLRSWHPQADEPSVQAPCLGSCPQARQAIGGKELQMHMVSSRYPVHCGSACLFMSLVSLVSPCLQEGPSWLAMLSDHTRGTVLPPM